MEFYFQSWVSRQEELLQELLSAPRDHPSLHLQSHRDLIARVLAHCHDYYLEKSRLASLDVLKLFSPSWLTPLERTFLWLAGWKPALAFRVLRHRAGDLSPDQARAVEELRRETAAMERELEGQMTRVQEAVATPQMLTLARVVRDGELVGETVDALLRSLERIVGSADGLRMRTVNKLLGILSPQQMVDFLAAAAELHIRVRRSGARRTAGIS